MIESRSDYLDYLAADRLALGRTELSSTAWLRDWVAPHATWRFQRRLRKLEFYRNCRRTPWEQTLYGILKLAFRRDSIRLGFSVPENVFGPGLAIVHYGTLVVNSGTRVGRNCRVHTCVNIGASAGEWQAPRIGDNVYIGPGAKIFGGIEIASNTAIGANSTVCDSFPEGNQLIAGSPARRIRDFDITTLIPHVRRELEGLEKGEYRRGAEQ